jgi:N utilization substance protein A
VFIAEALNPATIEKVGIDEEKKSALVVVADSQLSLAIGKNGQNVRLAAKLTGWKIDIISATEYEKEKVERDKEIKAALAEEAEAQREEEAARAQREAAAAQEGGEAPDGSASVAPEAKASAEN